jgi:hypothetical protein
VVAVRLKPRVRVALSACQGELLQAMAAVFLSQAEKELAFLVAVLLF